MKKKYFEKGVGALLALTLTLLNPGMTLGGGFGPDNRPNDDMERELAKTQNDLEKQKAKTDDLEKKLDDLNNRLETAKTPDTQSTRSSSGEFPIHGYFVGNYADSSMEGANGSFDQATLHLYLDYPLSETFIFHGDFGFNHGAEFSVDQTTVAGVGDVDVTEAWLDWKAVEEYLTLKFGKFYTPFGVWTPNERPYMTPSVWDPLLTRWALHSRTTTGIQAYSLCDLGPLHFDKRLYIGNGHGSRPHSEDDNTDKLLGGRLGVDFGIGSEKKDGIGLGISGQVERDGQSANDFQKKTWGFDAKVSVADFTVRGEITKSRLNAPDHLWSQVWFWQAGYRFLEKFEVYYRHDDGDEDARFQDAASLVIDSCGVAYWPIEQVVFKIGYDQVKVENQDNADYHVLDAQVAVRF